ATLLLVISPIFIYTHTISQNYTIVVPLSLATLYFFMKNNQLKLFAVPFAALTSFFEPVLAIISLIALIFFYIRKQFISRNILLFSTVLAALAAVIRMYSFPLFKFITIGNNFFVNNINIFGALVGFTLFTIILTFTGIIQTWKNKKEYLPIYIMILLLVISDPVFPGQKIFLNLIFSFLAAKGFVTLLKMKWELKAIRTLSTIIIIAGLLFSTGFYINNLQQSSPTDNLITSLNFLQANSFEDEIVLSHWKNKYWIEYYAERKAFSTNNLTVFKTRDEKKVLEILTDKNISYIIVDEPTRNLMKTEKNNLGLEFVMQNSDRFRKMITYNQTVVWALTP
ncbi:MAG: hypothetical protein ACOCUV_02305, partial [bacterium]